ncbi:MAG TPA: alpha/beta hydrolase [Caulobacteraceae bacterium]|jgi:pimeloyl-ACP methyl ester carboxylesterase/DNA-binding CsgD family transcriptional regulator
MQPSEPRGPLSDSFQAGVEALGGAWPDSPGAQDATSDLDPVVQSLGGLALHETPFDAPPPGALVFAILDGDGHPRAVDAGFTGLFPDDLRTPRLRELLRRAERGEPSAGLIQDREGRPAAVCLAPPKDAQDWPLDERLQRELAAAGRRWVLMAFVPTRSPDLMEQVASAFSLSRLQARVAVAMLEAPTLEIAAERLGVNPETAKDALRGAMRKIGASRTTALVSRLTDLICNRPVDEDVATLAAGLNVTLSEARVARLASGGATSAAVAETLGVGRETVKAHLKSAFSKVGVGRAKDLGRISVELAALARMARASELGASPGDGLGRLRIAPREDGRRVAFLDYGPAGGRPLLYCHALASGRTLPPRIREMLWDAGWRPIIPQRPGYGLTDPDRGDYLTAAAEDMAAVLDALNLREADLFVRDIAAAPALAFAERFPDRVGRGLLLNPEAPVNPGRRRYPLTIAAGLLRRHPEVTGLFFELLRRQLRTPRLTALIRQSFKGGAPSDIAALDDPEMLAWMVADIQAMTARSASGVIRERLAYSAGWNPPAVVGGRSWTVVHCAELGDNDWRRWWSALPEVRFETLEVGGLHLQLSHPEVLTRLLSGLLRSGGPTLRVSGDGGDGRPLI